MNVYGFNKAGNKYLAYSPSAAGFVEFFQGTMVNGPYGDAFHAIQVLNTGGSGEFLRERAFNSSSKWAVGIAFTPRVQNHDADLQQWVQVHWLRFRSGALTQVTIGIGTDGRLQLWIGGNGVNGSGSYIGSYGPVLAVGSWYYVEVEVLFQAQGYVKIWLAPITSTNPTSTQILNLPNFNTIPNPGTCNRIAYRWQDGTFSEARFSDMYIVSGSGGVNTGRLGVSRVRGLMPTADFDTAWARLTGTDNFQMVRERHTIEFPGQNQPDDDASYVSGTGSTGDDMYGMEESACVGLIHGVAVNIAAKGSAVLQPRFQGTGLRTSVGSPLATEAGRYAIEQTVIEESPDSLTAWNDGEINAGAWGFQSTAGGATRVSNFHLEKLVSTDPSTPFDCGGRSSYVY